MLEKIFFYDGDLADLGMEDAAETVDAKYGYSNNMETVAAMERDQKLHQVVTNQIALLDAKRVWNKVTHEPDIYLRDKKDGNWKSICRFTKTNISYSHDIEKMYKTGEFNVDKAYPASVPRPRGLIKYKV